MVKGDISYETIPTANFTAENTSLQDHAPPENTTERSVDIDAIKNNRAHLVPGAQTFVVEGSRGDKYAVTLLHPQETCQCPSLGSCYHILTAKISLEVEDLQEKIFNLTQLRKNNRKKPNKKARKKAPRPCNVDDNVIAAPDPVQKTNSDTLPHPDMVSIIPEMATIVEEKETVTPQSPVVGSKKKKSIITNPRSAKRLKIGDISTTPQPNPSASVTESPEWVRYDGFPLKLHHQNIIQNREQLDLLSKVTQVTMPRNRRITRYRLCPCQKEQQMEIWITV
jgi:hypothetical protein